MRYCNFPRSVPRPLIITLLLLASLLTGCDSSTPTIDIEKTKSTTATKPKHTKQPLRIAVGAMITPKEGFAYYRKFLDYIAEKIETPVEYVDKESYAEINQMLQDGTLDVAFVCSGPYVDGKESFGLQPLVAPLAHGEPVYYSYVIVPASSPVTDFKELRGKKFAFTDPQSNTGTLVPNYMLAKRNETPDSFFSSHEYTYAHDKSIKAVAMQLVDGATVDSLIWEYAAKTNPQYTDKTKIILKSPPYGIPPVVVRPGIDSSLVEKLRTVFLNTHNDERGRAILNGMMIDKFVQLEDSRYAPVREMKAWLAAKKQADQNLTQK